MFDKLVTLLVASKLYFLVIYSAVLSLNTEFIVIAVRILVVLNARILLVESFKVFAVLF